MLEWLIIGGGVHGTFLSRVLVAEARLPATRVQVLDPHAEPLACFRRCAAATGMQYLRSSVVHHLDREPMSLRRFASRRESAQRLFEGAYQRPSLDLFLAHCDAVIARHGLLDLRRRGEALGLERRGGVLHVETSRGRIRTRRVLLAMGASDRPLWPEWARELRSRGGAVHHLFDPGFVRERIGGCKRVAVLGGGMSAMQAALSLASREGSGVTIVTRHRPRIHDFDTDSRWMGPRGERRFARSGDAMRRRRLIGRERHRGSVPAAVARGLDAEQRAGRIEVVRGRVEAAATTGDGVALELACGRRVDAEGLLLATGFHSRRPGGSWLDRAIDRVGLECAPCGYPVVDASLCWGPGIYVTGALAELELGPTARNLHGARAAGRRLLEAATS